MDLQLETIRTRLRARVLSATFDAPPMNMIGPEMVRDLIALLERAENDDEIRVVVFDSADPDFFIPHVDVTKIAEYTAEVAKAGGPDDASLGALFRRMSEGPFVTIAKIRGVARGAGSEFALACDMRFASRERAVFGQPEVGIGAAPGAGAIQHLARLSGRGRALEAILASEDFDAELAERYGWINRALPDVELDEFVDRLASRVAGFPREAVAGAKDRINAATLSDPEDVRRDARLFQELVRTTTMQERSAILTGRGFQTRSDVELNLGRALGELPPGAW
jgi:enoyl-CoA hydratase/carnithine racemase